jgi:hypothetical protein
VSTRSVTGTTGSGVPQPSPSDQPSPPAAPVARASITADRVDLELAAAKGAAGDGIDVAVFSASVTASRQQTTLEGRMFSAELKSDNGQNKIAVENFSAKVNLGRENADGSFGGNFGLGANIVGIEGTVGRSGNTVTGGVAFGAGAELSVGTRDLDKDGSPELCGRVSAGFVTLGLCLENPF